MKSNDRITPARAGNSACKELFEAAQEDHPRACGEQPPTCALPNTCAGSPPRVRGTARSYPWHRAGNMDHPRACGEQLSEQLVKETGAGSPPRVRGTGPRPGRPPFLFRITPARAGNSRAAMPRHIRRRDHPRACGEQTDHARKWRPDAGSPPRVRGTGLPLPLGACVRGITPARAGNSRPARAARPEWGDHPRACGEQRFITAAMRSAVGSPPRVRGTDSRPCP